MVGGGGAAPCKSPAVTYLLALHPRSPTWVLAWRVSRATYFRGWHDTPMPCWECLSHVLPKAQGFPQC